MPCSEDLINFDLIETHKENIQLLPEGRSARQLVNILSPAPADKSTTPSLDETKTLNDAIRHEYELEVQKSAESDDPLDVFDRYVKWTLNAYPSAQATSQSQLLPLLERATKTFLYSSHYKNDPRYLKLWLHYIRWFSDAPRETFAYLARHNVGEGLALFYEEFAVWLESAGRWIQAEEIYTLGIKREARPMGRLMRKFSQFQQRLEVRPQDVDQPTSPALPTVRPALAAKVDPFASTPRSNEPQTARTAQGNGSGAPSRTGKTKMAIFSDADDVTPPTAAPPTNGWQSIGSIQERKKENTISAKPWMGETLKAGTRAGTAEKMTIFKDETSPTNGRKRLDAIPNIPPTVVNSKTGKPERVFVNLEAVYRSSTDFVEEMSFDELRAAHRGWMGKDWRRESTGILQAVSGNAQRPQRSPAHAAAELLSKDFEEMASINGSENSQPSASAETHQSQSQQVKSAKQKRMRIKEIKQETQTIKTNLASPTGPKIRRKLTADPTMTFHSKAATNDVYDLFNQPLQCEAAKDDTQSGEESDFDEDTYSTAGESTGTGMISGGVSESGSGDTNASARTTTTREDHTSTGIEDVDSEWTEFSTNKHMPPQKPEACQEPDDTHISQTVDHTLFNMPVDHASPEEELTSPVEHVTELEDTRTNMRFVSIPPKIYDPTPLRTFRDLSGNAQSRLPFMTPIIEKTESSLAATNPYQQDERDSFTSKTPFQSSPANIDSPSKIGAERLLLSSRVVADVSPQGYDREGESLGKHEDQISPSPKSKRPSRRVLEEREDYSFSPKKKVQITKLQDSPTRIKVKVTTASVSPTSTEQGTVFVKPALVKPKAAHSKSGPRVITDLQCNPTDPSIRKQILATTQPSSTSSSSLFNHSDQTFGRHTQLQRYAKKVQDSKTQSSPRRTINANDKTSTQAVPPILSFVGASRVYAVKRELGQGAFAPVYLVDSYDPAGPGDESDINAQVQSDLGKRGSLEAAKVEAPPSQAVWEFHIIHTIHDRLSSSLPSSRSTESIIVAHECHAFADEAYLILDYWPTGTLLDLVNLVKAENKRAGKAEGQGGLEEALAMFFTVELLRTVQDLHRIGILHGDLKGDNCLLRLPPASSSPSLAELDPYARDGRGGWDRVGLKLIDFGRGIDVTNFPERVAFIADWAAGPTDAPEIREARPWVWQIDLCGAAGVVHSLLFGKYLETVQENRGNGGGLGEKKRYRLREGLKRYWQGPIWGQLFETLLNPILPASTRAEEVEHSVLRELRRVRGSMEDYLELEGERKGLRSAIRRVEGLVVSKRR